MTELWTEVMYTASWPEHKLLCTIFHDLSFLGCPWRPGVQDNSILKKKQDGSFKGYVQLTHAPINTAPHCDNIGLQKRSELHCVTNGRLVYADNVVSYALSGCLPRVSISYLKKRRKGVLVERIVGEGESFGFGFPTTAGALVWPDPHQGATGLMGGTAGSQGENMKSYVAQAKGEPCRPECGEYNGSLKAMM